MVLRVLLANEDSEGIIVFSADGIDTLLLHCFFFIDLLIYSFRFAIHRQMVIWVRCENTF